MNEFSGLSDLTLESIENGICLEDVNFANVQSNASFSTSITVEGKYYPISANTKGSVDVYYYNGYIKMHIPKLMPTYNVQKPYDSQCYVNKNILINSSDTMPNTISKTITMSNYIRVKAPNVLLTIPGYRYGDNITCVFPNKNLTQPSFLPV